MGVVIGVALNQDTPVYAQTVDLQNRLHHISVYPFKMADMPNDIGANFLKLASRT